MMEIINGQVLLLIAVLVLLIVAGKIIVSPDWDETMDEMTDAELADVAAGTPVDPFADHPRGCRCIHHR